MFANWKVWPVVQLVNFALGKLIDWKVNRLFILSSARQLSYHRSECDQYWLERFYQYDANSVGD